MSTTVNFHEISVDFFRDETHPPATRLEIRKTRKRRSHKTTSNVTPEYQVHDRTIPRNYFRKSGKKNDPQFFSKKIQGDFINHVIDKVLKAISHFADSLHQLAFAKETVTKNDDLTQSTHSNRNKDENLTTREHEHEMEELVKTYYVRITNYYESVNS